MSNEQVLPLHSEAPQLYAGLWLRAVAYMIDNFLRLGVFWILVLVVARMVGEPITVFGEEELESAYSILFEWILIVMFVFYHPLFEGSRWQATPGKRLMGLKVVDMNGQRLSYPHSFARHAAGFLSFVTSFLFSFGYWMAGLTARKQALHDLVSNCLVIKDPEAYVTMESPAKPTSPLPETPMRSKQEIP